MVRTRLLRPQQPSTGYLATSTPTCTNDDDTAPSPGQKHIIPRAWQAPYRTYAPAAITVHPSNSPPHGASPAPLELLLDEGINATTARHPPGDTRPHQLPDHPAPHLTATIRITAGDLGPRLPRRNRIIV